MDAVNPAHPTEPPSNAPFYNTVPRRAVVQKGPVVRLLVIDDEVPQDSAMIGLLAVEGVAATCAVSGASGLELASSRSFDVILLDLKLPDMLGMTVLSILRHLRLTVPVVVVTGYFLETDHDERARQLGAAAFLRKPLWDMGDLAALLRRTVAHYVRAAEASAAPPNSVSASRCLSHRRRRRPCPELLALHQRALEGDVRACDAIASLLLPELRRRLLRKYPHVTPDWVEDSVVDALTEYTTRPSRYDPTRGLSLDGYLQLAAGRNLKNHWTAARRRSKHETSDVAASFWDAQAAPEPPDEVSPNRARLRSMLAALTADFTSEERTAYELQMAGEHRTSVYAHAMEITHLNIEEQVRHVRRLTHRISQRVRRGIERLRGIKVDGPSG